MSQGFKLRFDQMRESNPTEPETEQKPVSSELDDMMHPAGHARNLCLVCPDGRRVFYNYSYLVSAGFDPNNEMNVIKLQFSSESVILKGYGLEMLFMDLLDHMPRIITGVDARYADAAEIPVVTEIEIEAKE